MGRKAQDYASPWSATDHRWLVQTLWPRVEDFVNGPEPYELLVNGSEPPAVHEAGKLNSLWISTRQRLDLLLEGDAPLPFFRTYVTFALDRREGAVSWGVRHFRGKRFDSPEDVERFEKDVYACLMLLSHPTTRPLLGKCDRCEKYYLKKGAYVRGRFCSSSCRVGASNAKRKAERAAYMRKWRANHVVRARATKRKKRDSARRSPT